MYKILLFLFLSLNLAAQIIPPAEPIEEEEPKEEQEEKPVLFEEPKPAWKQRMHYGGNVWVQFWGALYADVSPMAGYDVTDKGTIVGLGASFIYQGSSVYGQKNNNIAVGGRAFVRQKVWRPIFAQAEYELMNAPNTETNFYNWEVDGPSRKWGGSPLVGIGFYQGRGAEQRGSFISVMYNMGAPSFGYRSMQTFGGSGSPFVIRIGYFF
ncbi:hypothetical protein [Lacihabitans sp. CS3-21]|uniref:hypothetical protein n=1 Tax=Lacihabitans sp. CS3-21 TaxID=2487332 RepID=UPI0020CFB9CA|nr:hypothetical protein [Lacihabitans sp. CS3-21]MCP9745749.1 hypothetical protein [Lacihabitans sp. CS3-21]